MRAKTRQDDRRGGISGEPDDQQAVCRCGHVCEHNSPGELDGRETLYGLPTHLDEMAALRMLGRGLRLCDRGGIQVDGKDVHCPAPCPRLRKQPRSAAGVYRRGRGEDVERGQAQCCCGMVAGAEPVACHLYKLTHARRCRGVAVTSPVPP